MAAASVHRLRRPAGLGWGLVAVLAAAPVAASSLQVSPTRVEITAEQQIVALNVSNAGNEAASVQLELMAWSQRDGKDHYVPSAELLATPPIFTVPAGSQQIIRIGLRRAPDATTELAYRLFLQELPPPLEKGFQGLQVVLRLSLPVFVAPATAPPSHQLQWQASRIGTEEWLLAATNTGNAHAQVSDLVLAFGKDRLKPGNMLYVLPGATREWRIKALPGLPPEAGVDLKARINGVETTSRVVVR